jgi:hypothetical protein
MPEPSTTVATGTLLSITALSLFSGVDVPALMGATAGASLFVTSAKDIKLPARILYLFISLFMGYQAGPSLLASYFEETAVCAFIGAACCIGVALKLISSVEQLDITKWIKPK